MLRLPGILLAAWIILVTTSCGNIKNLQYLQGNFDTAKLSQIKLTEPLVQKGDLLGITVYSDDAGATAAVTNPTQNMSGISNASDNKVSDLNAGSQVAAVPGFLVSQSGDIQMYKLGVLHVEGMTKKQISDTITRLYADKGLLKNPYVEVRFLNYKVTVLGEVIRPGTFSIPTEKINALEAISLAGDITPYGRRDNVLIIRETNGVRRFGRLDLSKPDAFLSDYYYLQQGDMIIVDVGKNKGSVNDQTTVRNITVAASVLATIAIFINIFRK